MSSSLIAAGVLALVVGIAHSVLGEVLIFRHLRDHGLVPTRAVPPLKERNLRIIWASWHALTVFGFGFALVLLQLGSVTEGASLASLIEKTAIIVFAGSSLLVLVGTKGRHPGWIGLLLVAVLVWLG